MHKFLSQSVPQSIKVAGTAFALLFVFAFSAPHLQAQVANVPDVVVPQGELSAEEQSAFRSAWLESVNANSSMGMPLRYHAAPSPVSFERYQQLQLSVAEPNYVPFQVVPPRSNLGGLFTDYAMGGNALHMGGDSHIMVFPNDPWRGWGRRGVSMFSSGFPGFGVYGGRMGMPMGSGMMMTPGMW